MTDLKPDNIHIVPDSEATGGERAKILDFGLAKIIPRRGIALTSSGMFTTGSGALLGSPAYVSPEQCYAPSQVDSKADVYSLGILFYQMLTGRLPFQAESVDKMVECHLAETPPPVADFVPETPEPLARLLRNMLAKKPAERPCMADVVSVLSGQDPSITGASARPPELARLARRPRRRFRGWPWLGGALVVALLAGLSLWRLAARTRPPLPPGSRMLAIPGGAFEMGSDTAAVEAAFAWCHRQPGEGCLQAQFAREQPAHQVTLSPFLLDELEVDNAQFADWLNRQPPLTVVPDERKVYRGPLLLAELYTMYGRGGLTQRLGRFVPLRGFEHRPVTQVTWDAASAYCRDHDKRLPSEAEWEYAAQGAQGFRFPWGDEEPRCSGVVYARHLGWACGQVGIGVEETGSAAQDRSPQGVRDLAGNVAEWVQDRYASTYPPCADGCRDPGMAEEAPPRPGQLELRVVRGGHFDAAAVMCRAAGRAPLAHDKTSPSVGFRCARSLAR